MTNATELPADALDRILLVVDHHAELARRSAVRRDRVGLRCWMLRRARQARLLAAWGLL